MASTLVDLVKIAANSTGTGAITLGSAVPGYRGVEALTNGEVYSYSIQQGSAWEYGRGTYLASTDQLIRTPLDSSDGGAAISIKTGAAIAFVALAEDLDAVSLTAEVQQAAEDTLAAAAQVAADRVVVEAGTAQVVNGQAVYENAYATVLPLGVTDLSAVGIGTGTGGTPGIYTGGATGAPEGFTWSYTIGSDGKIEAYQIDEHGLADTVTTPTLTYPSGSVTGATVPVATVATFLIDQETYWAVLADSETIGLFKNDGGVIAEVNNPDATQVIMYSKPGVDASVIQSQAWADAAAASAARYDYLAGGQRQLFDKTRYTAGKYVRSTDGALITQAGSNASHWIPVVSGAWYSFTSTGQGVWRQKDGTYISGVAAAAASPQQAPANTAYFQHTIADANLATYQFERGKTKTPYQAYDEGYRQSRHFYRTVPNAALQALKPLKNLVDPSRLVTDFYVVGASGALAANAAYNLMLPVPCDAGATYYSNATVLWACYDADMGFLTGGTRTGAGTFTVHASAAFMTAAWTDAAIASSQIAAGTSATLAQIEKGAVATTPVAFALALDPALVPAIDLATLSGALVAAQTAFLKPAKNLFNPADSGAQAGKYINNANGNVATNALYNCTGFVPVEAGKTYTQTGTSAKQHHAWYDAAFAYLSTSGNLATITAPVGAAYWRGSFDATYAGSYQIEEGLTESNWEAYRLTARTDLQSEQVPAVILPRKHYVLRGSSVDREQASIYPANAIQGLRADWTANFEGSYGVQLNECWRIEPGNTAGAEGSSFFNIAAGSTFTLSLASRASNGRAANWAQTTVNVVDKTTNTGTQIRFHAIGDSITAWQTPTSGASVGINYLQQISSKLTNAKLQGLRHYATDHAALNRDGRPGWSASTYLASYALADGKDSPFMFPDGISAANYRGNVKFWASVVDGVLGADQAFDGFQKLARGWADTGPYLYDAGGYPTAPTAGWIVYDPAQVAGSRFREWDGGAWVVSASQPATWSLDYAKFLTRYAAAFADGNPTHVLIMLQANDFQTLKASPYNLAAWKARIDTMIASIRAALPTAKIILGLSPLGADQDAWAYQYGAGNDAKFYRENIQTAWAYTLANYDTAAQEAAGVYVCAMGLAVDPVNSFTKDAAVPVNIYTANTIARTTTSQWVHPNGAGHQQMGDPLAALVQVTRV